MKNEKAEMKIDLDSFEVPWSTPDEDDDYDRDAVLEELESAVSASAVKVGTFGELVDSFLTSWVVEDHFYLYPWPTDEFDWALVRTTWDDNWGRWELESCARIAGENDPVIASRRMLTALLDSLGYDLKSDEHRHWNSFIENLSFQYLIDGKT